MNVFQRLAAVMADDIKDAVQRAKRGGVMRECWVIEEQNKETSAWFGVELYHSEAHAKVKLREWVSEYPHRVVRYVPADTVAPQEDREP